ncbi:MULTISPECIES: PHP domain-containing protein [Haloferax]|nr:MULTISPECIES: PHP domain-containing protein [Haloferax]
MCDLHIHSKYSFDSLMSPSLITRVAKIRGLSVISITDHGNMRIYNNEFSDQNRKEIFEQHGIYIIKGMEIKTNYGDIIGLFLESEISSTEFDDVISEIRSQNGVAVLPHPFHRKVNPKELLPKVDLVETVNGRCNPEQNMKARSLAEQTSTPVLGGSDAHIYWEIGRVRSNFSQNSDNLSFSPDSDSWIVNNQRTVEGSPLPYLLTHGVSFISGRIKRILR